MFKEFSAGYYIGQLYVESYDGNHVVMDRDQHVGANKQVYAADKGLERLDHPLVMKVDQQHVPVFAADNVPADTVNLPDEVLEATRVDQSPALKSVFIAKAERAAQLLKWTTPYSIGF